jgi:transcriptional regulator with XRE-family HTH domain
LVRRFFEEANKQLTTMQEIADRSGLRRVTISEWRTSKNPTIVSFQAALNVLGLELCIRRKSGP